MKTGKSLIVLSSICLVSCSQLAVAASASVAKRHTETGKAIYEIVLPECSVSLTTYDKKSINRDVMSIRSTCNDHLGVLVTSIGRLLDEVASETPLAEYGTLDWGEVQEVELAYRWAYAAARSTEWKDYVKDHGIGSMARSPAIASKILEKNKVFAELYTVFGDRGCQLSVSGIEGLLTDQVKNITWLNARYDLFGDTVVPYSAMVWFKIRCSD